MGNSWKIILALIVVLGWCVESVWAEEATGSAEGMQIGKILVAGNASINESQILTRIRSRVGENFSPDVASKDAKRIAELTGLESSYYNTTVVDGKVQLTFVVVEKSLIRSITFVGNKSFRSVTLSKKAGLSVGKYLDPVLVANGRKDVIDYYHEKGFAFVEVVIEESGLGAGKVVYTISEGPKIKIGSVKFSGNKAITTKELRTGVKSKAKKYIFWQGYYSKENLDKDVINLQKAYQERGHLDVSIKVEPNFSNKKDRVDLSFVIIEGPVYTIDNVNFAGVKFFGADKLSSELKLKGGMVYNEKKAESDTKQILQRYREVGFIEARVEENRKFIGNNEIAVDYFVNEGERFRIGQINISGNEKTQDKVIRHVLDENKFVPGQWYNADIARGDGKGNAEVDLKQTLLAESATITPTGQLPGQRDGHVDIIEGKTGSIMLGAGIASDSGLMGQLVFEQRNFDISNTPTSWHDFVTGKAFHGAGQTLRVSLEPGTQQSQYSIDFSDPYFKDKPITLSTGISSFERGRESYDEQRLAGYLGFEKRYEDKWRRSIGFRAEKVDVKSVSFDAPQEVEDDKGANKLFGVKFGVGRDLTDDRFNPTKGYTFNASAEPVGGDHTFAILSTTYRRYITLYEDLAERKTILSTKLYGGVIGGTAPVFEKFYAGGSSSIRGFAYRGVSTRGLQTNVSTPEKKDPIGSDWLFLANAEVTMPVIENNIAVLFFIDSGAIDTGGYRASIGTGFQILIPQWFGPVPMRFEFAVPFMKNAADETQIFSFSVGRLF
jgi:outer membrane protein insertion porin family